jgi:uncharacterized protein YgiM (DUF1202 family)
MVPRQSTARPATPRPTRTGGQASISGYCRLSNPPPPGWSASCDGETERGCRGVQDDVTSPPKTLGSGEKGYYMSCRSIQRRPVVLRALMAFTVMLFLVALNPATGSAQTQSCTNCTLYAITELNLRQEPSLDAAVLRFIPALAPVHRGTGAVTNGYAPVTYEGVTGWAVALGLVATREEAAAATMPATTAATTTAATTTAPAPAPAPAASSESRVTLTPLMLRSGPGVDAEPILVIPEGGSLTLTREGAADGYVTVDYDGATGWVYADLIAREDELG